MERKKTAATNGVTTPCVGERILDGTVATIAGGEVYELKIAKADTQAKYRAPPDAIPPSDSRSPILRLADTPDLAFIALVKLFLAPSVAATVILLLSVADSGAVLGPYIVLAALGFALSAMAFGSLRFFRESSSFPIGSACTLIWARWAVVVAILGFLAWATGYGAYFAPPVLLAWVVITPCAVIALQVLARVVFRYFAGIDKPPRTAIVIGASPLGAALSAGIHGDAFSNTRVAGFFDDRAVERVPFSIQSKILGRLSDVPEYVKRNHVEVIYLCVPTVWQDRIRQLVQDLGDTTASIYFVPDVSMFDPIQSRVDNSCGIPAIAVCETPFFGVRAIEKRFVDLTFSCILLLLLWPAFFAIAIAIKFTSPGPVFYKQRRYGLDGEIYFSAQVSHHDGL